jgi:hypothetical protein
MTTRARLLGTTLVFAFAAVGGTSGAQTANADLPPPQRGLLPSMRIAEPEA